MRTYTDYNTTPRIVVRQSEIDDMNNHIEYLNKRVQELELLLSIEQSRNLTITEKYRQSRRRRA
jgi:polyhydroxyalkanoate synthesis regulator phasin